MNTSTFTVGVIGNVISVLMFLSPVPTFWRIVKQRSTEDFESLPYICTFLNSALWVYYGVTRPGSYLVATINGFGVVTEIVFVALFLIFTTTKSRKIVITTKSVEYMPFFLSFFFFLNGGIWTTYAVLVHDWFLLVPNGIGFLLGTAQLLLYAIYKNSKVSKDATISDMEEEPLLPTSSSTDSSSTHHTN